MVEMGLDDPSYDFGITSPTSKELAVFTQAQKSFSSPLMLRHFVPKRQLYIDMDSSQENSPGAHKNYADQSYLALPRSCQRRRLSTQSSS